MRQPAEISIELTAQELLAPATGQHALQIDDIGALEVTALPPAPAPGDEDYIEIELTPREMDALLSGGF